MKEFDLGLWDPAGADTTTDSVRWGDGELHRGDRVRMRPRRRADIMDMVLSGRTAIVESIERDYEDVIHVAVLVDDDPGKDLGALRQPGHRFFFSLEDIEPVGADGGEADG
jgi:hypothetical protein